MLYTRLKYSAKLLYLIIIKKVTSGCVSIPREDNIKIALRDELSKYLKDEKLELKIDEITAKILEKKPKQIEFNSFMGSYFNGLFFKYTLATGQAANWEFQVKILADKFGVELRKDKQTRKDKIFSTIGFRDLDLIIKELNAKTNGKLKLDLSRLNKLRSALIHGNLDQLRELSNNPSKSSYKKEHEGKLVVFNIKNNEKFYLSSRMTFEKKQKQGLISWFIENTNSQLLDEMWREFGNSIRKIQFLINLHSLCFNDRSDFLNNLFAGEKTLNENYIKEFNSSLEKEKITDFKLILRDLEGIIKK